MALRGQKSIHHLGTDPFWGIKPQSKQPPQTIRLNFHVINEDESQALLGKLHENLKKSSLPTIVKIGESNCTPCKAAQASLEEIVTEHPELNIITIHLDGLTDRDRDIFMENFKVEGKEPGLPTIRFFPPGSTQAITERHLIANAWMGKQHLINAIEQYLPEALRASKQNLHQS